MPTPTILLRHPAADAVRMPTVAALPRPAAADAESGGAARTRIWDLAPSLHCSVVGTCLTPGDLRQLFVKLDEADAGSASDHALHGRAVRAAGRRELAGKLLDKMLAKRHEAHLKRFARAKTVDEVRRLWGEALARGDIPGAYWATLTHPAADRALVQEAFGEVHMLSHLVGSSNRADIARLRELECGVAERDDKIARQEARLRRAAHDRAALARRVEALERDLRARAAAEPGVAPSAAGDAALARRLADEAARAAGLSSRCDEQARALKAAGERIAALEAEVASLSAERAALETAMDDAARPSEAAPPAAGGLDGLTLLYVGGRPKLIEQLRALTARRGGVLISHDGGVEERAGLLPGLVSQCDVALFPVDCVSHHAAERVKRLCRQAGKPFVALRSASAASFAAALTTLPCPEAAGAGE